MITVADSFSTYDLGKYYAIFPSDDELYDSYTKAGMNPKLVKPGFAYVSDTNPDFQLYSIRQLIKTYIYPDFEPARNDKSELYSVAVNQSAALILKL